MNLILKKLFFIFLSLLSATESFAALEITEIQKEIADLKIFVESGIKYIKTHGQQNAYQEFNKEKGRFKKGDLYIFVMGYDGVVYAHGDDPQSYVGRNFFNAKDRFGTPYFQLFADAADRGGGLVSCYYPKPGSTVLQYKTSFVKDIDGKTFIGAGIFKDLNLSESREKKIMELKKFVDSAVKYYKQKGAKVAFDDFSDPNGKFIKGSWYIFVADYDGWAWAHGGDPKNERNRNISNMKDEFGTPILALYTEAAKSGGGLVGYYWHDYKKGGSVLFKTAYIKPLEGNKFIGSGYYEEQ